MKLISTTLFLLFVQLSFGQEVVTTGGDSFQANGLYFDVTIGEVVTETFSSGDVVLTQGMQQPGEAEIIISVQEFALKGLNVYPNPTSGLLTIDVEGFEADVRLTDLSGKPVKQQRLSALHREMNLSDLPSGTYLLQVHAQGASAVQRVQLIH